MPTRPARPLDVPILMPGLRLDRDARTEVRRALDWAKAPWTIGFCVFGGTAETLPGIVAQLEDAAGRPLRFASDMERGAGQQVRGLSTHPPLAVLGAVASPQEVEALARRTARDARSVGVDVLFAPVLDVPSDPRNPIVGARAFAAEPARVAALGAAYVRGALAGGAQPVGKHWPGHGATVEDSHDSRPEVFAGEDLLDVRDIAPFRAALDAGLSALMTAHVAYPQVDASGETATTSGYWMQRARALAPGRTIAMITDALLMGGALGVGVDECEAARRALLAGADVLLYPEHPERVAALLFVGAPERREALWEAAQVAADRAARALIRLPLDEAAASGNAPTWGDADSLLIARRAVARAGVPCRRGCRVVVVDDDGCHGPVLVAHLERAGIPAQRIASVSLADAAPRIGAADVVVLMAEVRAWKGAIGAGRAAASWFESLPPGATRIALAPLAHGAPFHLTATGPEVEQAVAEALLGGL